MKLSEQLKQDHESGDFGKALEGYSERAEAFEEGIAKAMEWNWLDDDFPREIRDDLLNLISS